MRVFCFLGLVALAAIATTAPAPKVKSTEYSDIITNVLEAAKHIRYVFKEIKTKIEYGKVIKGELDLLRHIKQLVTAEMSMITEQKGLLITEIMAKMKSAVDEMIAQVQAGIEQVKPVLQQLIENIIVKMQELKDEIFGGQKIFDDIINDIIKPVLEISKKELIQTIVKHMGDLAEKLVPSKTAEYLAFPDIKDISDKIRDIFKQLKTKIELGEVKGNIVDFFQNLKNVVDAKISEATPVVRAALEKVKAAIDEMIAKAKAVAEAGIESGRGLLVELLGKIMAKLGEAKDNLAGYNIFNDLLNDVLKPALGTAIEGLIPTIVKHLGDLSEKLVPSETAEYLAFPDIKDISDKIRDIFNQLTTKIELGEVKANIVDFFQNLKNVVDAKIGEATPVVRAALEKVKAAIDEMIAKIKAGAEAGIELGRGLLVDLFGKIMAKLGELKDNLVGYNIFNDLLNDVLKPAIKHAIENLIPTIDKHLSDLADKLKPAEYLSFSEVSLIDQAKSLQPALKHALENLKTSIIDDLGNLGNDYYLCANVKGPKLFTQKCRYFEEI